MAVKTIIFQAAAGDARAALVASEAAIASNLNHRNVVATYSHDLRSVSETGPKGKAELGIFKFFLIQVCAFIRVWNVLATSRSSSPTHALGPGATVSGCPSHQCAEMRNVERTNDRVRLCRSSAMVAACAAQ